MTQDWEWFDQGGVTSPLGFRAGASYAGIKTYGEEPRLDVALLTSDAPTRVAGTFTRNAVCGAPVTLCRERVAAGRGHALVVNSGCSNVAMGERGVSDARRMAALAGEKLGLAQDEVLVASTGVIGRPLPMDAIALGIGAIALERSAAASAAFARAIMTTDTVPKSRALRLRLGGRDCVIAGAAKGSGMVHPDMATVLCFLTTDAAVEPGLLQRALAAACDDSLNMLDVDMDTSTSDTLLLWANGAADGTRLQPGSADGERFAAALRALCVELARDLARDGEGAQTLIECTVAGAASPDDARRAARTIVSSPLVKTMVTGRDPNLGRVLAALGRSGARVDVAKTSVYVGDSCAFTAGAPTDAPYETLSRSMDAPEVKLRVELGLGAHQATAWGCDLTAEYVRINGDYTT